MEMTLSNFIEDIGVIIGVSVIFGYSTQILTESVDEYLSQRRKYKYYQKDPQLFLSPEYFPKKPSFIKILKQETKEVTKEIFSFKKKKRLENNL